MVLTEILPRATRLFPDKEAVVCGDLRMDYGTFASRVWKLANGLLGLPTSPGDRVAILHKNCHIYLEAYFATAHLGLILVPLNYRLSARELAGILKDSGATVLIAQREFANSVMDLSISRLDIHTVIWHPHSSEVPECTNVAYESFLAAQRETPPVVSTIQDEDVAHLYYTSGTTGRPKGVMLTHKNVKCHALGAIAELGLNDSDNWIHVAPLFHLADAWATFAITWVGGKHILVPEFDPLRVFQCIEQEKVTLTNMVPTMLNLMVNHPDAHSSDTSSLRVMLSGGASIARATVQRIIEVFGCDYIQTYGMTETSPFLTLSTLKGHLRSLPEEEKLRISARTGREFITVNLKVVDDAGIEVAQDNQAVGEIIVRGDTITPGYWNAAEETREAFRDGWLYTGDLAVIDSEGYINIVDRKKDMIITGGENVFSIEVENVLYRHPAVLEAAVIGVPDDIWGEAVKALVVLKHGKGATEAELIVHCRENLAHYKAPRSVEFLERIPRTGSEKISKKALRDRYQRKDM